MNGMEMMLSRLIGVSPDEMRKQVESALHLMKSGAAAAEKMQRDIDAIKQHLGITENQEVIDNGGRTIANRGNSANHNHIQL
jgi:hypothetical protein